MKIQTSITTFHDGKETVRGHSLEMLMQKHTFTESIFLLLIGVMPDTTQTAIFDAILTAVIDHGPAVASAMNARISASAKNPLHASVAAGLLGLGERHGVVISQAMEFLYEHVDDDIEALLRGMKEKKQYVMGYGHKIFTEEDPRATTLFAIAKEHGVFGKHCQVATTIGSALNKISSKPLPLNADGAIAAILCDMGFDARLGNGLFVIARVPGLVAHIVEEQMNDVGIRRLSEDMVEYV